MFKFSAEGRHGDIIFCGGDGIWNLGYNYVSRLPIVPWVYYHHVGRGNLFRDFTGEPKIDLEREDLGVVESALEIASGGKGFDEWLFQFNFAGVPGGRDRYEWSTGDGGLILTHQCTAREVVGLSPDDCGQFVQDYLEFTRGDDHLGVVSLRVEAAMCALRDSGA